MVRHIDSEPRAFRTAAPNPDSSAGADSAQVKLLAFTDFIEDLVSTATGSKREIRKERLQEDIKICIELGRPIIPLGLIFAASSSFSRQEVFPLLTRLPALLAGDLLSALDRVSETMLMVDDPDLRASAAIATSVLVQRALPAEMGTRDRMLLFLMELVDVQFRERRTRHGSVFAALRHVERAPTLVQLPNLLSEISDALEDLACERDVFLDNPIDVVTMTPPEPEAPSDIFKVARVQSGASLPSLSEEMEQATAIAGSLGWSEDRGIQLLTDLYRHRVMDTRSKLGLNLAAITKVMADLDELFGTRVADLQVEAVRSVSAPYSYDIDSRTLTLNVGYRGGLTARVLEEEHPRVLEELRLAKADREATTLSKAVDRYRSARAMAGGAPVPEEDEAIQIEALAALMGVPAAEAYDMVTGLYGTKGVQFSADPDAGISLEKIREMIEIARREGGEASPGSIVKIAVDPEGPAHVPFRVDRTGRSLVLHTAFEKLTDRILDLFVKERAFDPFDLVEPDQELLSDYDSPGEPGSVAIERNIQRLIVEFGLSRDDAPDALAVLLNDCPTFRDSISIQALRTIVATINSRLGSEVSIDVVTGWSREAPGSRDPDRFSVAWLTSHAEEGMSLNMLTFNFGYGEGRAKLPPISDELILEWCRHYRVESRGEV